MKPQRPDIYLVNDRNERASDLSMHYLGSGKYEIPEHYCRAKLIYGYELDFRPGTLVRRFQTPFYFGSQPGSMHSFTISAEEAEFIDSLFMHRCTQCNGTGKIE